MDAVRRAATRNEYPLVSSLIRSAFGADDETDLWEYIAANDPDLTPDGIRLSVAGDRPVACTVVLPRDVVTRAGWVRGAIVTLVGCHPDWRNRGHAADTVRDALEHARGRGLAVAFLYGHPGYYRRFGFVPVLPRWEATIHVNRCPPIAGGGTLRAATMSDLDLLTSLFDRFLTRHPLAVRRVPRRWLWAFRPYTQRRLLVSEDGAAYAVVEPDRERGVLRVSEAAACGPGAGRNLLATLADETRAVGLGQIAVTEPPDHILARLARVLGGEASYRAAAAGMALILDWDAVLPDGYAVSDGELCDERGPVLRCPPAPLTQLALGYHGLEDLLLLPGCETAAGGERLEALSRSFPRLYPRWHLAPFW